MGMLDQLVAMLAASATLGATIRAFGGEDPLKASPAPDNWHHEGLTRQAAQAAGWAFQAENELAFHADFLDSYLYNPLWWFDVRYGGGPERVPIVMSSQLDLKALHFDDLVSRPSVLAVITKAGLGPRSH